MGNLKKNARFILVALSLYFCACSGFPDLARTNRTEPGKSDVNGEIKEKRELAQYAPGGMFDCAGYGRIEKKSECDGRKFSDFIWRCWTEKKRGYLSLKYNSTPDVLNRIEIFIEPDARGEWRIDWNDTESYLAQGQVREVSRNSTVVAVERIADKPRKGDWSLSFKDNAGQPVANPFDRISSYEP